MSDFWMATLLFDDDDDDDDNVEESPRCMMKSNMRLPLYSKWDNLFSLFYSIFINEPVWSSHFMICCKRCFFCVSKQCIWCDECYFDDCIKWLKWDNQAKLASLTCHYRRKWRYFNDLLVRLKCPHFFPAATHTDFDGNILNIIRIG